ncbi:beta-D-galactosidase [Thioclava dalianensis]|uniref:Beta-D-galactosidase n=1 Tax=Thioclava dalianensis TaxID=1185766 RepID=A0A074TFT1_9RHOB|nr:glycoside hydrolase family 2 TIM barrel-domain containing protein [Thioclava dalianensis]KEP70586.1 beta-D-galactosidase [Thioclava dalianensis]SFN07150.1 beta-galactosidase [Thioclava dalianensis]
MRTVTKLNTDWHFAEGFSPDWINAPLDGTPVCLPHNAVDMPMSYFDETGFQRAFTYQREITWAPEWAGQRVRLRFDAAMADAVVWLNGVELVAHRDGYTPFTADLTDHLVEGSNRVTVKIDGSENPQIPPFGGRIDYLTYAGIYRDVWLEILPEHHITSIKIETPDVLAAQKQVSARIETATPGPVRAVLRDPEGTEIARAEGTETLAFSDLSDITLWTPETPALYSLEITLPESGDSRTERFGFRHVEFTPEGFFLNGKRIVLRGLNRHQSFPYSGYAQGKRAQERDAEILRHDLGCNVVRTSHYPQSPWFLDRCDEIGLMVFEEIPGWQHIGEAGWKDESVANVERMIRRDWNHPSIIIWGVRINESPDDDAFYERTNATARALDTTRPTGGVRCITDSTLLEDVYTMNDFILGDFELPGSNRPRTALRDQQEVTGLPKRVPYLVTEYNGHMYPTKASDPEHRQVEHVIRHLDVLNAAHDPDAGISGCIGWCMFDYNTHKDFGAGDRICHHGVMSIFREPKYAAFAYSSQKDPAEGIVLEPVTAWSRGERNIGGILPLIVLTNCDAVELSYDDVVKRVEPDRERYPHLPHPPVIIDHRHFTKDELGSWGASWRDGKITGYRDGKKVAERHFPANPLLARLEVVADDASMPASPDEEVRVMIRARDQSGNKLPFLNEPVQLDLDGPATLIGPDCVPLTGGATGCWLRLSGTPGTVRLTARLRDLSETAEITVGGA